MISSVRHHSRERERESLSQFTGRFLGVFSSYPRVCGTLKECLPTHMHTHTEREREGEKESRAQTAIPSFSVRMGLLGRRDWRLKLELEQNGTKTELVKLE